MNTSEIKFYIVTPVYKTEKYIRQCIDSVLAQTYQNYELILVDDGSPDQAGTICDEYQMQDNRIHVIHKENGGQLSARQRGIEFTAEKICSNDGAAFYIFLDSDDTLQPNALEVVSRTITQEKCDVVVFGTQRVSNTVVLSPFKKEIFVGTIVDKRQLYKRVFQSSAYNSLCRKAIKCEFLLNSDYVDYYHIRFGEDLLQSIPVYKNCRKAVFIPDILYNYTVNPQSVTQEASGRAVEMNSTVRAYVWSFLESENVLTEQDKADYLKICRHWLKNDILRYCSFAQSRQSAIDALEKLHADAYYSMLLASAHKELVLNWVRKRAYGKVIFYAKIRARLASGYRCLRRLFRGA